MDEAEERTASLRLALVGGIGPRTRRALLEHFGSAGAVFSAARRELSQVAGVGRKVATAIVEARDDGHAEEEIERCRHHCIDILLDSDGEYPQNLQPIYDPPGVLFRNGTSTEGDSLAVAIVGTRHATHYGRRQAERLAGSLARAGLTVVSGLARGIDAAAHRGALSAGGRTIAVLGSGLLSIYPPEHAELAKQVTQAGAVYSEMPPLSHPQSGTFPQRNRLISGLSLGVVVVEAPLRSGALITTEHAIDQGREVFALPGPIDSRASRGCHRLLREGAKLVENIDDILQELGPMVSDSLPLDNKEVRHPGELQLNEQELAVLRTIEVHPTSIDDVVRHSQLPVQRVLATVSVLEMRHLVRRVTGSTVVRV